MPEATVEITVPYHDCDPGGVVWHGNYLRYFDAARCALLDTISYGYLEMAAAGHVWPIIDLNIRYLRPVKFHETIRVVAKLEEYEYRLLMTYQIISSAGEVTTEGVTKQVAVDLETNEMCLGSPQVLLDRLGLEP